LNLDRKCDPEGILEILLKNNFPVAAIRTAMGDRFPHNSRSLNGKHPAATLVTPGIDHKAISQVRLTRLTRSEGVERIDSPKIQLYLIEQFLSAKECDDLVNVINGSKLRPSTVTYGTPNVRTSKTSDLSYLNDPVVNRIDEKVSALLGI